MATEYYSRNDIERARHDIERGKYVSLDMLKAVAKEGINLATPYSGKREGMIVFTDNETQGG